MRLAAWTNTAYRRGFAAFVGLLASTCLTATARAQDQEPRALEQEQGAQKQEQEVSQTPEGAKPPRSHRQQRVDYLYGTFGPPGLIEAFVSGTLQQWRNVPREWGQSGDAYVKRLASEYGEGAITDTTKLLVARMLDEDPAYARCQCTGFFHRLGHAALGPVSARKPDGRTVFSLSRVAGATAGKASTTIWYPRHQSVEDVARHVGLDVVGNVGMDILREFVFHRRR
jgi:hypothetical protein